MPESTADGVLVIVAGGNIALYADEVRREWVVRPVEVAELQRLILGDRQSLSEAVGGTIVLREANVRGTPVRVDFHGMERNRKRQYEAEDLDSAQVDPTLWEELADTIKEAYPKYGGFVVLHGLDTMAYTASALSFMLGNPSVPIVLTGSQRSLNFGRTDAIQNIISAIAVAAGKSLGILPTVPEICVYSHDTLYRGNRVTMVSSSSYRSFDSPNYPPLATVGEHIEVHAHVLRRPGGRFNLHYHKDAKADVVILDVFPGMDSRLVSNLVDTRSESFDDRVSTAVETAVDEVAHGGRGDGAESELRGVLLRTYGLGTAPTSEAFLNALRRLVDAGIVVMNVTQAKSGRVSYANDPVSLRLLEQGVVSGVDMTAEAAYAKMVILLSEAGTPSELADRLQISSCGEQTQSVFNLHFDAGHTIEEGGAFFAHLSPMRPMVGRHQLKLDDITFSQVRLLGVRPVERAARVNRSIEFKAAFVDRYETRSEVVMTLADDTLRWRPDGRATTNVAYEITAARGHILQPEVYLQLETSEAVEWSRLSIAIFANVPLEAP